MLTASKNRDIAPTRAQRWTNVTKDGPTLSRHWKNVSCLLRIPTVYLREEISKVKITSQVSQKIRAAALTLAQLYQR